ncbi:MAG TPA: PQQ-binding-like beta-propeller repeat protein, partial [Pirellulaceae bacterium]|nr:PQQ-binding-like beta-propeller repeat protein [Pirellulaceae bacterium]
SDGRQVYVIDELGYAAVQNVTVNQVLVFGRGQRVPNNGWTKSHNLLVALDLARQGYQVWAVGGTTADNPALAGAFFLGPPLPAGDQLFALAEFSGEIRLLCLDPRTGGLLWKQQLAVLDEGQHIVWDSRRRLAGSSPSLAEGILICPTSAGALIAVDLATRTLRWGYQYGRSDITVTSSRVIRTTLNNEGTRWLDATATIADGCVVLTPVEEQRLHCLDLLTGKAKWPPQARDDMLFVACVHDGKIVLVGQKRMKAISLADGKSAWPSPLELGGESIVGRGYYSDHFYYLPVTGQQLLKIDLDTGKVEAKAQTEVELGNLVCYKDQLISQSPQTVASFVLHSESLQKQLDERLAKNPQDIEALLLRAQILLQEGKANDSLKLLREAYKIAPEKPTVRGLLAKVMLVMLRQDFAANLELTEELDKLVTDPAQRREVLRFRVQGLARTNRTWEALAALLELADQELESAADRATVAGELQTVDRDLSTRSDRWLQGQMRTLLRGADSTIKDRLSGEIKLRLERAIQSGSASQLRALLNLFGFDDSSTTARLALAEKLIAADALLEAEMRLGEVLESGAGEHAGTVRAALAALYEKARRPELAARWYQELAASYAGVVCRDGLTGKQLAERAAANSAVQLHLAHAWPHGQVEVKDADANTNFDRLATFQRQQAYPVPMTRFAGAAPRGLRVTYDLNQYLVSIRSDLGQTLATTSLRNTDGTAARRYYPHQYSL